MCHPTEFDIPYPGKFVNQVGNLNSRRHQYDHQYPRQCVWRAADLLQLLFMRWARWPAPETHKEHRSATATAIQARNPTNSVQIRDLEAFAQLNITQPERSRASRVPLTGPPFRLAQHHLLVALISSLFHSFFDRPTSLPSSASGTSSVYSNTL